MKNKKNFVSLKCDANGKCRRDPYYFQHLYPLQKINIKKNFQEQFNPQNEQQNL